MSAHARTDKDQLIVNIFAFPDELLDSRHWLCDAPIVDAVRNTTHASSGEADSGERLRRLSRELLKQRRFVPLRAIDENCVPSVVADSAEQNRER